MIHSNTVGKTGMDGELMTKFFDSYEKAKLSAPDNIGWRMINEVLPASHLMRYSTSYDSSIFNIKFLEPQNSMKEE
jgi:hypothetical protein